MVFRFATGWLAELPVLVSATVMLASCGDAAREQPDAGVRADAGRLGPGPFAVDDLADRHGDGCGLPSAAALALTELPAPGAGIQPHAGPVRLPAASRAHPGTAIPGRSARGGGNAEPERVVMRLLLLTSTGSEPAYGAAKAALDRLGVPHQVVVTTETDLEDELFRDPDGTCLYQGVILTESSLPVHDPQQQTWVSTLSTQEWSALAAYEQACGAREAVWYAFPDAGFGMTSASNFTAEDTETAVLTGAGAARFSYLQPDATIPIADAWGYRGQILDPDVTEALVVNHRRRPRAGGGAPAAGRHRGPGHDRRLQRLQHPRPAARVWGDRLAHQAAASPGCVARTSRRRSTTFFWPPNLWVPGAGQSEDTTYRIELRPMSRPTCCGSRTWRARLPARGRRS
jgi:hypothetical protein